MAQLTIILLQVFAVAISGFLAGYLRAPLPLIQILLGVVLFCLPGNHGVPEPWLFLLLFVAPLLYLDAFSFPQSEFARLRKPIIAAAIGLVVFTVVGTGLFIHWLIPSLPISISFAIASVLSPTDAVAVAGCLGNVRLPSWLMHILEGEALLNDASGLVCLRFALAAAVSGSFSFGNALGTFLWVAVGSTLIGIAVVLPLAPARQWMQRTTGSASASLILIHLLIPFAVYMVAEEAHVSGVLAVVAAGFAIRLLHQDRPGVELRLRGDAVTDALQFTFNGLVFVLLGLQLPDIAASVPIVVRQQAFSSIWTIPALVAGIAGTLMGLRFCWVLAASYITQRFAKEPALATQLIPVRFRAASSLTLAGVRGAVTLAAVLSFPLASGSGEPLPGRGLAIILSAGVMLIWLVSASAALPWLVRGMKVSSETATESQEREAHNRMIEAAIARLEELQVQASIAGGTTINVEVAYRLSEQYRRRLRNDHATPDDELKTSLLLAAEKELQLEAIRAERKELRMLEKLGKLEHSSAKKLIFGLDTAEAALLTNFW